jgi:hypothetical protein
MVKFVETPGRDNCFEWDNGTTLHCVGNTDGKLTDPIGLNICVNIPLPDGGHTCVILPFMKEKELDEVLDYIKRSFEELQ